MDAALEPPPWDLDHEPSARTLAPSAPPPAEGVAWAEFPLRAGALLIDLAMAGVVTTGVGRLVSWLVSEVFVGSMDNFGAPAPSSFDVLVVTAPIVVAWIFLGAAATYLVRVYRATPGQMALGLFTVREDGHALTAGAALVRFIAVAGGWLLASAAGTIAIVVDLAIEPSQPSRLTEGIVVGLPVVWYSVLAITILRDPRGRGIHDRLAGSVVVRRAGPPS